MAPRPLRKSRFRWLLYLAVGFVVLLALLFVALQTSFAREQIRVRTNAALAQVFRGRLAIERIGNVTPWGVSGVDARVYDEHGQQVFRVQGLEVVASLPGLAYQLLAHGDRPELYLPLVHVAHVDATLREDEELGVTLAGAFMPRPSPTAKSSSPDAGPRLRIGRIVFDHIWAHGRAIGSPPLDAELRRLEASLSQSPIDGFALDLERAQLVSRGLPFAADPSGTVAGVVEAPARDSGPLRLEITLDGRAAGSPLALEASWVGDDLHARVSLLGLPSSFVNQQAPGLRLDGDLTLVAEVNGPLPQLDFTAEIDGTAGHMTTFGYAVVAQGRELGATLFASRLDLARVVDQAPASALDLRASVLLLEEDDGHFAGSHRIDVGPGRLTGQGTPALWLNGRTVLDTEQGVQAAGKLGATEAGAGVNGSYDVRLPSQRPSVIRVALDARLEDPPRLAQLGIRAAGKASLTAEVRPEQSAVSAKASVSLSHVNQAVLEARNVEAQAVLSGSFDDPRLHGAATADLLSGRVHGDLSYSKLSQTLELFAADLDLLRLSHVLGVKMPLKRGVLALDARVSRRAPSLVYSLDATANLDAGKIGGLTLRATELELPQSAPTFEGLGVLRGELVANGNIDLEALSPLLTSAGIPIERTTGRVRFELTARHRKDDPQGLELAAQVDTNGLRVVEQRYTPDEVVTTADAIAAKPTALEGIDFHLSVHSQPRQGDAVGTLILRDAGGTLLETQAEIQLARAWQERDWSAATLARLPLRATFAVPRRRLGSLPPIVRPTAMRGRLSIDAALEGSVAEPRVNAHISAESVRASGSKDPVDVAADVSYESSGGKVRAQALLSQTSTVVGGVEMRWSGDLRNLAKLDAAAALTGDADVTLREFPLDVIPMLTDRQVTGRLTGDVKLANWGNDAQLQASLSSTSLAIGSVAISDMTASAYTTADKVSADVGLKVASGTARATLDADARWGKRPLPELQHRGHAKLETHAFKLEALSPLIGAYVSEIGGMLDASTELDVTPAATKLTGTASLEQGVVQIPSIGQRFSDISARFGVADDQFRLERLEARGTTGRLSAKGAARLDGFQLRSAEGHVVIKKNESLPLTLEGADIGDAWGNVDARYTSPAQGERKLQIDVPEFHLVTPETSGYGLQSLDRAKDIRVGVRRADGVFVPLPVQPLEVGGKSAALGGEPAQPLRIVVKLGSNVSVERGRSAQAQLTGQLTIETTPDTNVQGRIEVRGGKLDVQGKRFEIERGVVTFEGTDPGNPTITATARWDAPGYTVYADYVGDVKEGRIKLHAEPPLTQNEIATLMLFGSPEGTASGSTDPNAAALAVGVAGGTAAKGLNQVIDDFTRLDVSARVDTTTGSARPELVFQVSPRVSAKVTRAVGAPAAGESPDRTFLTLELRLRRAWALSAIFGDHGASALDLIWRRRY